MEYGKACQLVLDECRQALGKVDEGQVKEFISLVYSVFHRCGSCFIVTRSICKKISTSWN